MTSSKFGGQNPSSPYPPPLSPYGIGLRVRKKPGSELDMCIKVLKFCICIKSTKLGTLIDSDILNNLRFGATPQKCISDVLLYNLRTS